ncbi:MAG: tRNA uridine-5-carboxymethylaminomethyl(34) synthesis GTPase MnmE [Bacteroidetes bacterium]|nr:tRNA uridine-5-carboxymethylaminomethyl(34) synthesis GTPase MnmE [Bacteroidota bacterium]
MSISEKEPIAAIATPIGEGGIAVLRVSGRGAIEKVHQIFKGVDLRNQSSHTVHFGRILDSEDRIVDEVLVSLFRAPKSYTGEETVEISCHGGILVTQKVLETILRTGVRAAEAGEFTQRAFLNGKLGLEQAEAVADLIHARSLKAVEAANQQLSGSLGAYVRQFRQQIIDATAMIELELDFIEEDVEFANKEALQKLLEELQIAIRDLLQSYEAGRLIKDGIRTVLVGRPNAGKSTLLNALIGSERAIVTDIAGTTRDTVDAEWNYGGLLFRLIDTAGLRHTEDLVEAEGVKRSQKAVQEADVVVYLKDVRTAFTLAEQKEIKELQDSAPQTPMLFVTTQIDRMQTSTVDAHPEHSSIQSISSSSDWSYYEHLQISAETTEGLDSLKELIKIHALQQTHYDGASLLVTSSRHRDALEKTLQHVDSALMGLANNLTGDFLAIDLRAALQQLGAITGEITNEDILDSIFSRFCIGK